MSALAAVMRGRARAETLMLDTCVIDSVTDNSTDPTTAVVTPTYGAPAYTGKCKLQNQRAFPSTPDAGEHKFTTTPNELHLPVTAVVATGQRVRMLTAVDPVNVGRVFRIRSTDRKSLQTALRCQVEEVVG